MAAIPTARIVRPSLNSIASDIIFPFLAPSVHSAKYAPYTPVARFSTSPALWKRDNNKNRGVSALRHTGPRKRQTLSVSKYIDDLPKPVEPEEAVAGDANHGLWGFFHEKKLLRTPVQESSHGRAWTVAELRKRNWTDLHSLWWVCVKERNRLATEKIERERLEAGYGDVENRERDETVRETMQAILDTLEERHKAWEKAHRLAVMDPDIDLTRTDGPQYLGDQNPYDINDFEDEPEADTMMFEEEKPKSLIGRVKDRTKKILWNK